MCKNENLNDILRFSSSREFNSIPKDESIIKYDFSGLFESEMTELINKIRIKRAQLNKIS